MSPSVTCTSAVVRLPPLWFFDRIVGTPCHFVIMRCCFSELFFFPEGVGDVFGVPPRHWFIQHEEWSASFCSLAPSAQHCPQNETVLEAPIAWAWNMPCLALWGPVATSSSCMTHGFWDMDDTTVLQVERGTFLQTENFYVSISRLCVYMWI